MMCDIFTEPSEKIDCNFDNSFCEWRESDTGLGLNINAGFTPLPNTGPEYDNTQNNLLGKYVYLGTTYLNIYISM